MVLMNGVNGNKGELQDSNLLEIEGMLVEFFKSNISKKDLFIFYEMYFYRNECNKFSFEKYDTYREAIFECDKSNFLRSVKKLIASEWLIKTNTNEYKLLYHPPF